MTIANLEKTGTLNQNEIKMIEKESVDGKGFQHLYATGQICRFCIMTRIDGILHTMIASRKAGEQTWKYRIKHGDN
jgi:hypothetical protein